MKLWYLFRNELSVGLLMSKITDWPLLYDLLYQDVVEDIAMYLEMAKPYQDILEYGAGTGRVTIPLLEAGHFVLALDLEAKMLESLKQKAKKMKLRELKVINADMCDFFSKKKFSCVFMPLTTFNYLLTKDEQNRCLQGVHNNLRDEGIAVIELLSLKTFEISEELKFVRNIKVNQKCYYQYFRKTDFDFSSREIKQKRIFKLFENDVMVDEKEVFWINRFVTIDDFYELCLRNRLKVINIYGDCQMNQYNMDSEDVFVVVKKCND